MMFDGVVMTLVDVGVEVALFVWCVATWYVAFAGNGVQCLQILSA